MEIWSLMSVAWEGHSAGVPRFLLIFLIGFHWVGAKDHPDVVVVVGGKQGWGQLSMRGSSEVNTPHLDALAESGIELSRFYATPVGATTFASLLTGRYHYRTGASGDVGGEHVINSYETTVAELFLAAGYRTAFFGAWRNGDNWPHCAEAQGFSLSAEPESKAVIEFFNTDGIAPLFGAVSCEDFLKADHLLGELMAIQQERDLVIVYLAECGPSESADGELSKGQLYGSEGSVHEGGVRVPCFVSLKGTISGNSRFQRITSVIDLLPTLLELGNVEMPKELVLDGLSLLPALISGGEPSRWPNRILFNSATPPGFDLKNAAVSVRTDRWLAVRDAEWCRDEKLAAEFNGWELYDLVADPFERFNVSMDYPFLISDMKADFSFWMNQTTRFGLKQIPTGIGHQEWPQVRLRKTVQNGEGNWPVKVVKAGWYEVRFDSGKPVDEISLNGVKTKTESKGDKDHRRILLSEETESISCSDDRDSPWTSLILKAIQGD